MIRRPPRSTQQRSSAASDVYKRQVKPNKVFDWTHYFPKANNRYLPLEKIDDYLKNVNKPFCLIIASDYPHGPFPKTGNYSKADIFKLPYDPNYVGNHKPGYYQNLSLIHI